MTDDASQRLFGVPGAEDMHFDLASAYEAEIDPYIDQPEARPTQIEEWSVCPATSHVPAVDRLIDWTCEQAGDELDEDGYQAFENAAQAADVKAAFQAALDLWASKVTYRMADELLCTHTITWDAAGDPLVDGEPMYVKAPAPLCGYCGDPLGGGPNNWFSLVTTFELCPKVLPHGFHEPALTGEPASEAPQ